MNKTMDLNSLFEKELVAEMETSGRIQKYSVGQTIMDIGTRITHIPFIISGSIKVMTENKAGDELLLYYLEKGDTCSVTLQCCLGQTRSNVKAIAETDTELLFIPAEKMDYWMMKYQSWRSYVLDSFNERFNEMLTAIDHLVFHNLEARLIKYLRDKSLANKSKQLYITHAQIAKDLNSSRVVISRLMKKLEKESILAQERSSIQLLNFADKKV